MLKDTEDLNNIINQLNLIGINRKINNIHPYYVIYF